MKTVTIHGGFCSEYNGMDLWVKDFSIGAEAAHIEKNKDGTMTVNKGVVSTMTSLYKDNGHDENKYNEACNEILDRDCCCGEFVIDDDIIYVGIDTTDGTTAIVEYHDTYFC